MHQNILWRAGCAMLLALSFSACNVEQLDQEIIARGADDGGADKLTCVAIADTLVANLPRSTNTPASAYDDLTFMDWCERNIFADDRRNFVGNANAWTANEDDPLIVATSPFGRATRPTLAHGARLDIHALEPRGTIPFIRKIHFANWEGPAGSCALEMRVYQKDIGATGRKPLLYFHGGGWSNRATTMTAAEILTTHLIDSHVVFMPSYPLHKAKDGPAECRNARFEDILTAAQQAFDWVVANKDVFGATGASSIDVMGHSAGGQLAAYVAAKNRETTGKLVNFYGPVEFAQFIDESDAGGLYADSFDDPKELLASLLRVDELASLERPYSEIVMSNSLSDRIITQGAGNAPPFFMVQGNADETVPVEQALLACNALGGNATPEGGIHACGNGSYTAIIAGAGHNLDRRCIGADWLLAEAEGADNMMETLCPTRGADYGAVRTAVRAAFDWLTE